MTDAARTPRGEIHEDYSDISAFDSEEDPSQLEKISEILDSDPEHITENIVDDD